MKLICIKYCGGCNPVIDRAKLVREIKKLLSPEFILSEGQTKGQWDIGILVCGCLTACANKPDFKNFAVKWIVIAGHSVDNNNAPEKELADIVLAKLKAISLPIVKFSSRATGWRHMLNQSFVTF